MEILGYIATIIVLSSFLMKKMTNLRVLNSIGASLFIIYGLLIVSGPVVLTNGLILGINIIKLVQHELERKNKD